MRVGLKVKDVRKQKGMTQGQLAQAAGMSQPVLSQIENGKACTEEQAKRIAAALGVKDFSMLIDDLTVTYATKEKSVLVDLNNPRPVVFEIDTPNKAIQAVEVPYIHAKVGCQWQRTEAIGDKWVGCRISVEMPCAPEHVEATKAQLVSQLKAEVDLEMQKILTEEFRLPDNNLKFTETYTPATP